MYTALNTVGKKEQILRFSLLTAEVFDAMPSNLVGTGRRFGEM